MVFVLGGIGYIGTGGVDGVVIGVGVVGVVDADGVAGDGGGSSAAASLKKRRRSSNNFSSVKYGVVINFQKTNFLVTCLSCNY